MTKAASKVLCSTPIAWAIAPWFFWAVIQFHKPGHADPFWLASYPFLMLSSLPAVLMASPSENWLSMSWVMTSSAFNLITGTAIIGVIFWILKRSARAPDRRVSP